MQILLATEGMNMPTPNRCVSRDGCRAVPYFRFEMLSWWGGRLKALRRIPHEDIVDEAVVSLFFLTMSALVVVPMVTNM